MIKDTSGKTHQTLLLSQFYSWKSKAESHLMVHSQPNFLSAVVLFAISTAVKEVSHEEKYQNG